MKWKTPVYTSDKELNILYRTLFYVVTKCSWTL